MTRDAELRYSRVNAGKADFRDIRHRRDPRAYHTILSGLDCVIPEVARPILLQLAEQCIAERGRPITILDLGCSYSVNSALMRHGVTLAHLRDRYLSPQMQAIGAERVAELDASYFSGWPARWGIQFIGLDVSAEAVSYGRKAGLLAAGIVADLEKQDLKQSNAALIACADMIISTRCTGHVTATTFTKLMTAFASKSKPWIACFMLRSFDYTKIATELALHGLATEKLQGATFVQRRFRDAAEYEEAIGALAALGIDPSGKESEGLLHAELFVSRPRNIAAAAPLTESSLS